MSIDIICRACLGSAINYSGRRRRAADLKRLFRRLRLPISLCSSFRSLRVPPHILIATLVVYIVTSVLCATSVTIDQLVTYRVLHVLCSGAAMVIARSMVHHLYDRDDVARTLSLMMLVMRVAPNDGAPYRRPDPDPVGLARHFLAVDRIRMPLPTRLPESCTTERPADGPRHRSLRPTLTRCIFLGQLGSTGAFLDELQAKPVCFHLTKTP